jgi:hypothetical protein
VLYLPNHGINSRVFCDCFSVILVFKRARYLAILTLNQVLWLLVVEFYRITYSPHLGSLSLDGFSILHPKLGEYVLNVFCLTDEGALLELLDLKS